MELRNVGIKHGYPNLKKLTRTKLAGYIQMVRPFTLLGAFTAGIFLTLLTSNFYNLPFPWILALEVGVALAALQAGGQALNQSIEEEVDIDRINRKNYRPTVNGSVSLLEGKLLSLCLFFLGAIIAFTLNFTFGMFTCILIFFAVFYTAPPLRVKRFFILNNLWQGISRGFLPFIAVWSLAGTPFHPVPISLGIVVALWVTGAQGTKDFEDVEGDRTFGIKTLPVVWGRDRAINTIAEVMVYSFVALFTLLLFRVLSVNFAALFVLIVPSYFIIRGLHENWKVKILENNFSWGGFYVTLILWFILPAFLISL